MKWASYGKLYGVIEDLKEEYYMTQFVYKQIIDDLKMKIFAGKFADMRLPDERSLSETYQVSRSSIKRALTKMENVGIIFKNKVPGHLLIHYT